jgi:hypothetical protein
MSEETTIPEVPTPEVVTEEPQGSTQSDTDWKAESRKWEARAKAAKSDVEAAQKWREYETSQKTEFEKLAENLTVAQAEAAQAKAELTRLKVAAEKGIPAEALQLLKGSSEEELAAEADLLLSLIANQSKPKTPQPDANQGQPSPSSLGQLSQADLSGMDAKQIMQAKNEGRLDSILGK